MSAFSHKLIIWHAHAGRHDLPWQQQPSPYRIWVSEIMLQQTRVPTVLRYYPRFIERFADLASLAAASEREVLALWSGLGYYARARHLHACARHLCQHHGGEFPRTAAALATLPGIGRSTAAAIAAFAFGERAAILDGNVKRILCRCFAVEGFPGEKTTEQRLWALAESLLPAPMDATPQAMAAYTQAQMDLGATLCTRSRPDCPRCPLREECRARANNRVQELPAPRPKKTLPLRHAALVLVHSNDGRILLLERPATGIWGGLYSLPECAALPAALARALPTQPAARLQHSFTHFRLALEVFTLMLPQTAPLSLRGADGHAPQHWLVPEELANAPLPAPIRRILATLVTANC